jgi:hypothetical protein
MAYLPMAEAVEGNALLVEYMNEQFPVTVAVAGSRPLFDPSNSRLKGTPVAPASSSAPARAGA